MSTSHATPHRSQPHDDLQALWREVGEVKVAVGRLDSGFGAVRSEIGALRETIQKAVRDQRPNTLGIVSAVIGAAGVAVTLISLLVGGMTWSLYRELDRDRVEADRLHHAALERLHGVTTDLEHHVRSEGHPGVLSRVAVLESRVTRRDRPAR